MMKKLDLPLLLGYAVGTVSLLFGLSILLNWWDFPVPAFTRNMFGIVMILLGVYRFSVTSMHKRKSTRRYSDD